MQWKRILEEALVTKGRNIPSDGKGERSYSASGFESDVSGSLNDRYSGSDENVAGENGASFDSSADLGILDAVSGNESVHASPDTEVSCANSFSEEEKFLVTCRMFPKWKRLYIRILVFLGI